jgi:hypothetical protein
LNSIGKILKLEGCDGQRKKKKERPKTWMAQKDKEQLQNSAYQEPEGWLVGARSGF